MTQTTLMMTNALALATVGMQIFIVVVVAALFSQRAPWPRALLGFLKHHALAFGFLVAVGAFAGSIYYSDIVGYEPCSLCWWQRVFIYPQMILFAIALWRKDKNIFDYTLALSIIGGVIALYHSYIQYGGSPFFECGVDAVSCAKRFVFAFDYITIPLMSLTTLVTLGLISVVGRKK
ncbi:MAG: disulfide bond formation protein B [Patescibacteria group bacterium]